MLAIAMLLVGMIVPINLRDGLSDLLFGATFMWIIVNQEAFFGKSTKKATTHRHE
ncbi:hypothetical protein FC84_GL001676 [Lapidilactobacillus dextrinicus DSM 20335]|uniref:Uncharacterized protein n=2 Tax=Lapidilactobacillus dextrinicus TaxID=51664 RepID=A0A0R2BJK9_9LACO|nr:hypothetical protein FC84_GL001676 [Lapidilactobacillus dextrinicus DSM 20335]